MYEILGERRGCMGHTDVIGGATERQGTNSKTCVLLLSLLWSKRERGGRANLISIHSFSLPLRKYCAKGGYT